MEVFVEAFKLIKCKILETPECSKTDSIKKKLVIH